MGIIRRLRREGGQLRKKWPPNQNSKQNIIHFELPCGLVVKNWCGHCCDLGPIPGLGTLVCHRCGKKKKKKNSFIEIPTVLGPGTKREACLWAG